MFQLKVEVVVGQKAEVWEEFRSSEDWVSRFSFSRSQRQLSRGMMKSISSSMDLGSKS